MKDRRAVGMRSTPRQAEARRIRSYAAHTGHDGRGRRERRERGYLREPAGTGRVDSLRPKYRINEKTSSNKMIGDVIQPGLGNSKS